jgi:hypothetical protein
MATLDEITQERQRISERLAQLDAERTKLSDQLNELETAARVLKRFGGKADTTKGRRRGHMAGTTLATRGKHQVQGAQQVPSVLLSDASLKAVQAHRKGATSNDVLSYLSRRFGITVRPKPSRYSAATTPPCRPARKPRSALVPAVLGAERALRAVYDSLIVHLGTVASPVPHRWSAV